jgi:ankyrin repeat protein
MPAESITRSMGGNMLIRRHALKTAAPLILSAFASTVATQGAGQAAVVDVGQLIREGDVVGLRRMLTTQPALVKYTGFLLTNSIGWTLLHVAVSDARKNAVEICSVIIKNGADVNAKEGEGNTPLHLAVFRTGRKDLSAEAYEGIIQLLLGSKADVRARNHYGVTPLHFAVIQGADQHAIELLLAAKPDVNAKVANADAWTPLHGAVAAGRIDLLEILISHGADLRAKDGKGKTPLDVAEQAANPNPEIIKILRERRP